VIAVETLKRSTMTFSDEKEPGDLGTQGKTPSEQPTREAQFTRQARQQRRRTAPDVQPDERGSEKLHDDAGYVGRVQPTQPQGTLSGAGDAARVRSELARDLLHRVAQLAALVGDVSLPASIQLFKRDLSRCHAALRGYPSESDFLSIITLVESALTQMRWKEYSRTQFERIRSAIEVGYRQSRVEYADYERIRRGFAEGGIDTHPRINLESLTPEEMADAEDD
jgi:hypothetical protein